MDLVYRETLNKGATKHVALKINLVPFEFAKLI